MFPSVRSLILRFLLVWVVLVASGCSKKSTPWVIRLDPAGMQLAEELKDDFDKPLREISQFQSATIIYSDDGGIQIGVTASESEVTSLIERASAVVGKPLSTGSRQGVPEPPLRSKPKRFVEIEGLTPRADHDGVQRLVLQEALRSVNFHEDPMSQEEIGSIVIGRGQLRDYAKLSFGERPSYLVTTGHGG